MYRVTLKNAASFKQVNDIGNLISDSKAVIDFPGRLSFNAHSDCVVFYPDECSNEVVAVFPIWNIVSIVKLAEIRDKDRKEIELNLKSYNSLIELPENIKKDLVNG